MWHVSSRSGVATLRTAIHLLHYRNIVATPLPPAQWGCGDKGHLHARHVQVVYRRADHAGKRRIPSRAFVLRETWPGMADESARLADYRARAVARLPWPGAAVTVLSGRPSGSPAARRPGEAISKGTRGASPAGRPAYGAWPHQLRILPLRGERSAAIYVRCRAAVPQTQPHDKM